MKCRMNVADLTTTDKAAFVKAVLDLKSPTKSPSRIPPAAQMVTDGGGTPNRYDDYVWLHFTASGAAHRGPAFGPWHREFLRLFELDLQRVSGNPELTVPYWDWVNARDASVAGFPFTTDLMGGFGNSATGFVTSGPFSNPATWRMNVRLPRQNNTIDADLTLKRSRGVPAAADLPTLDIARRSVGAGPPAQTWPTAYDAIPWHDPPPPGNITTAQLLASFRKFLERLLHDGVHPWIGQVWDRILPDGGHMSFPAVAVNDPVFWLHHCNVDRLWSIWQRRSSSPGYLPTTAGTANAGHSLNDSMNNLSTAAWFADPLLSRPVDVQNHKLIGPWYHSDVPEVSLTTPSVAFGSVPELLTTFMPIRASVRTCQPVTFEITSVTGANFSVPAGQGAVTVDHVLGSDTVTARVYVQFTANGTLNTPVAGVAAIRGQILDRDGFDGTNPGVMRTVFTATVNLSATPVPRPRTAVSLVLDRSGSMAASAGVSGTRFQMLQSSLAVIRDVMREFDGVGVVTFDDSIYPLSGITALGPATSTPAAGTGRANLNVAIASPDLVPQGFTGIGAGIISGVGMLDAERVNPITPYQRFALCVMTDGNENETPYVSDPSVTAAISPYNDALYAIGLGRPGEVSDAVLSSISRYMLITGDVTPAERRFRLAKYFVQILAGMTRTAIVVDPQGELHLGSVHRIPFELSEFDIECDVIVLSPAAPLIEFTLEAPDGTVIDSATALSTVEFHGNLDDVFYRLSLPIDPGVLRSGTWVATLRLPDDAIKKGVGDDEELRQRVMALRDGAVPYSLLVQSYSDLELDVALKPTLGVLGEDVYVAATLTANGQPFDGYAQVEAIVTDPNGVETAVPMVGGVGMWEALFVPSRPGVHIVRVVADGKSPRAGRFQRENSRTVSIFRTEIPGGIGTPKDDRPSKPGQDDLRELETDMNRRNRRRRALDELDGKLLAEPTAPPIPADDEADHGHDHGGHDHPLMFTMFTLDDDDRLVEVGSEEIARDTSSYDEHGNDPAPPSSPKPVDNDPPDDHPPHDHHPHG